MMRFIKNPNLPEGRVSRIICGEIPVEAYSLLKERNIEIIECERNNNIDPAVSTHADMCALHLGENRIIIDKNQKRLAEQLRRLSFNVIETNEEIAGEYPDDVKVNIALFGKNAVGAFYYSDSSVILNLDGFNKFKVKQGYTKCSVLPVDKNALITDDPSVYKALKNTFDLLLVDKGDIALNGYGYGFIGGCAAKISKDDIFFFGDIRNHRNYEDIIAFLTKHSCNAVYPENSVLTDVGGIVSLFEYI